MTSEPKSQAQSDEALITEARAEAELFRRGDYLHGSAQRMRTAATLDRLADRLAALTADHAEAFAGKVVLSQAAFEELRGVGSATDEFVGAMEEIGAIGRKPSFGKHRATNRAHLRELISTLDERGERTAADTICWLVWWSEFHSQRFREEVDRQAAKRAAAESPTCPDCGTALHLVCLECHPLRDDGGSVEVPKLDDEAQRRDVEAYLDGS